MYFSNKPLPKMLTSTMNGGLDFCDWSKNDTQIANFMAKPIEIILGKYGKGLVNISLSESGFEKNTMSPYEVLTRCNDGYENAAHGGKIEICFASVGIQVRQHVVEGQHPTARRVYDSFCEKVEQDKADQLIPNVEALGIWLSLLKGGNDEIRNYIEKTPIAQIKFSILDRYRQMIKLRCLISENRLEEAMELAVFLSGYFTRYERNMYLIENEILKGIILYRMGDEHWKNHILQGLRKAYEYKFIRVISLEGMAIYSLLNILKQDGKLDEFDSEYIYKIIDESGRIASIYPDYLKYIPKETVNFTKREAQVLALLCSGMSMEEICEKLGITYAGLKKHNRNIYRKLEVKDRADAERKALQMGLVHVGQ